ncbi:peptidase S8 [Paenibacillus albiflavus]|uniref:Peptidase S8 n=1 Tax=Paenibacillus albiflavus TaxID=2545760 RepID=A0A4R4EKV3_9BACL|nr:S8 family peptidase [Paenibacillus albiflavus]TCZ78935.1 peptidase S8 [Paenibacillus albiflavus]
MFRFFHGVYWGNETLDYADFYYTLQEEIRLSDKNDGRSIIRFHTKQDYEACFHYLEQLKEVPNELKNLQFLSIINAISCSIRSHTVLINSPMIKSIEEDIVINIHDASARNGPNTKTPKSKIYNGSQMIPWGVNQIKAPFAWKKSLGNKISIGVIDTGIDPMHPDLRAAASRGINLLFPGMPPTDDNGHGTHIAGIIAASSTQQGILGVAPLASIHAVKAFDRLGSAYVSDIIAGIDWCVENEMNIINMSFGMKTYSLALESSILTAYKAGVIIVASCGNEGRKATIDYPARFQQVLSVGALTRAGKVASFSNKGKRIDIYAPGENIYSCWLNNRYNELSGTSMATAHVTGVVALMLAAKPTLKPLQVKQALKRNSIPYSKEKRDGIPGQINARRVMNSITRTITK